MIELMPAAHRPISADQRRASERQVADGVDRLVAHELVGEPHTLRIEHAVFGDHDRILERGAERVTGFPELGDVAHETEGPGPRQIATEYRGFDIDVQHLPADYRMIEFDLGLNPQALGMRPQLAEA